ncbi:hypothetical protein AXF19_05630 [Selenomonas sp. oral taxon 126]|nr:hypothetical protein AXF19_05630 [Selenomonas sp. oral taxon 126]
MEGLCAGERVNDMLGVVEGTNDVMPCICVEQCDAQKRTLVEQVSKVADLSKKQVRRTKLIGKQVVWENVPRTQAQAKCDWLTLTARGTPRRISFVQAKRV